MMLLFNNTSDTFHWCCGNGILDRGTLHLSVENALGVELSSVQVTSRDIFAGISVGPRVIVVKFEYEEEFAV